MNLELIIVGNELLQGKIADKNGPWLAHFIQSKNISLSRLSIIKDSENELHLALQKALQSNKIVLISGGLGPTEDDLTKRALASFFSLPLHKSQQALEISVQNYQRQKREYNPKQSFYHHIPQGFQALDNPTGFAPGLHYEFGEKLIFALPGVPHEFESMFEQNIYPHLLLPKVRKDKFKEIVTIRTVGIAEERIFKTLRPSLWEELSSFGQLSSLPQNQSVDLSLLIESSTQKELQEIKEEIHDFILTTELKEYIWQLENISLEETIVNRAKEKKLTFSFAESCTGGLNASRITDIPGSSAVFMGSAVTYSNEAKMKTLGVKESTLKEFGAVSTQTAQEMANGALKLFDCDIAIATTGIAGPGGGSEEKPVGTIGIALATKKGQQESSIYQFNGSRLLLKSRFSQKALFTLLKILDNN